MDRFGRSSFQRSFISQQTYDGVCMTTDAMVELVLFLLHHGLEFASTRRISQGSLERYFGYQRSIGRRNENPNIHEFGYRNSAIVLKRQLSQDIYESDPQSLKKRGKIKLVLFNNLVLCIIV